ncbi:hypothetical protein PHYPSEUDO_010495 [Phytophthora pseudosyringae]|uniref:RxLR effector protein n=1 Tax=Phytophthora pseudosyringae TaxID=221518 RepID=A0A8T1W7A3_9STRA|nr:hypothetical protein PHYPSEUDO_010495 [Phytophthora pseudosyringae]
MRLSLVFALFVVTLLACYNGLTSAETGVQVNAELPDSVDSPISGDITRRNLRDAAAMYDEERGLNFAKKVAGLFKSNPGLSTKVETLQKNPTALKNLEKAAVTQKTSSKLRTWFARLDANSSVTEKFFVIATILLFGIGAYLLWKR